MKAACEEKSVVVWVCLSACNFQSWGLSRAFGNPCRATRTPGPWHHNVSFSGFINDALDHACLFFHLNCSIYCDAVRCCLAWSLPVALAAKFCVPTFADKTEYAGAFGQQNDGVELISIKIGNCWQKVWQQRPIVDGPCLQRDLAEVGR